MARLLLIEDNTPFRTLLGHPERTAERLEWIEKNLDFDILVSGHASPQMLGTRADVREARQYFLDLSAAMSAAEKTGHAAGSPEMVASVKSALAPKYGGWRRFEDFLPLNVEGAIRWRSQEP